MNKILIINLGDQDDIFKTGKLVQSIKYNNSKSEISILTYSHFYKYFSCLKNMKSIYKIDGNKIFSLKSSPLFCDSFAINELMKPLRKIKKEKWDCILNTDNNSISNNLASYLNEGNHIGSFFEKDKSVHYSNYWAKVYQDIIPYRTGSCLSKIEILHQMIGIKLKDTSRYDQSIFYDDHTVREKIMSIKESQFFSSPNSKLIGIFLEDPIKEESISLDIICKFLNASLKKNKIAPVLIISSSNTDMEKANKINNLLIREIPTLEYNIKNLHSILSYIDGLITTDSSFSTVADLVGTPTVEICLKNENFSRKTSTMKGNIIMKPIMATPCTIEPDDIMKSCLLLLGEEHQDITLSKNITIYKILYREERCEYFPIEGHFKVEEELTRIISKDIIYLYNDSSHQPLFPRLYKGVFYRNEIQNWLSGEKNNLLLFSRKLLNCLRSVSQARIKKNHCQDFIKNLDNLLECSDQKSIFSIPIILFKSNIQSIRSMNYISGINMIESELFSLKRNFQKTLEITNSILKEESDQILSDQRIKTKSI